MTVLVLSIDFSTILKSGCGILSLVMQICFFKAITKQNLPGKFGQQSAICWDSLGLLRDYDLNDVFCNKTFLFFKIESWNFQHLFKKEFCETSQNVNSFSSFRQFLFPCFLSVVWLSWNFARFHQIQFQIEPESFSFLSWKTKKVLFLV